MTVCKTTLVKPGQKGGAPQSTDICCSTAYSQTLFLGCSVKSFNASLGWGGEASRLSVELVVDNCAYPTLRDISGAEIPVPTDDDSYTNSRKNNSFKKDENGNSVVPAKVYYVPVGDKIVSRYWAGADPGFYADMPLIENEDPNSIDIIGCAVYFKYDDFEFNGVVKSWENTGGAGGTNAVGTAATANTGSGGGAGGGGNNGSNGGSGLVILRYLVA